jgi:tRNA A37 threonylcarbamoyladenosine modification protein TsaB
MVDNNFFVHDFNNKTKNNDQLVISILNLVKKHKVNLNNEFSILVNSGPGSFSSIRISLAVAKGIKLSKKINLFGFKNSDLGQFNLANIELLIKKDLIQKNLIKPLYLS